MFRFNCALTRTNLLLQYKIVYVNFHSMRMFPIFLLLPVTVYAATNCPNINNATTCGATAGCYWNGTCGLCPANHFCTGWNNNLRSCEEATDGDFNLSFAGSSSINDCYADIGCIHKTQDNILQCKHYSNDSFWCPDGISTYRIHIEPDGNCYTGILNCGEFPSDCNGSPKNDIQWNYQTHQWMTAENNPTKCICEGTSYSDHGLHCTAKANKTTTQNAQYATQQISYDSVNNYWCTKCDSGYYVDAYNDLSLVSEQPVSGQTWCHVDENDPGGQYTVCKCTQVPKGSYLDTACPAFGAIETLADICPPNNCGAGKTTNNAGTIGNNCHYTSDTKFCDAKGCFNITDAADGGWDWD